MAREEGYGPTWNDVEHMCDLVRKTFAYGISIEMSPPTFVKETNVRVSWRCTVKAWKHGNALGGFTTQTHSWGYGGAARTAPAAIWHALSALYDQLEERHPEATVAARKEEYLEGRAKD
jgi:hypothetical protein